MNEPIQIGQPVEMGGRPIGIATGKPGEVIVSDGTGPGWGGNDDVAKQVENNETTLLKEMLEVMRTQNAQLLADREQNLRRIRDLEVRNDRLLRRYERALAQLQGALRRGSTDPRTSKGNG